MNPQRCTKFGANRSSLRVCETSGTVFFLSPIHGTCFGGESCLQLCIVYITYDCSNKDADKKGLRFFWLPKDHKLRLTWFKKLRLVDPPNTGNVRVCSEHFTEECFIVGMQAMGFKKTKKA